MNKKLLIIGGGIVVIGAGAYFYFMNKKKKDASAVDTQTPTSGTSSAIGDRTTENVVKGTIVVPSKDGGLTPPVITTPSNTTPSIENQEELDRIMDAIKNNIKLGKLRAFKIAIWKPSNSFIASGGAIGAKPSNPYPAIIERLKNDLFRLGYEYREGSDGAFLVKI
jgi:hypothetical protein